MSFKYHLVNKTILLVFKILCNIDDSQLKNVPLDGPLIIAANHINFLEAPILFTHLIPRRMTALVKEETWNNPALGFLFTLWDGIPIRRGEADLKAFQSARKALSDKKILVIAPEGTRSGDGQLGKGYPGIVLIAQRTGAPIIPIAHYGGEQFWDNFKHFRRTKFRIIVGKPFTLKTDSNERSREVLQQATDEIMYQIASLLPAQYRGEYADLEKAGQSYLSFDNIN